MGHSDGEPSWPNTARQPIRFTGDHLDRLYSSSLLKSWRFCRLLV